MLRCMLMAILFVAGSFLSNSEVQADEFQDAVDTWLNGNDRASLAALSRLAHEGHSDARLLLSRIEHRDLGPSPFRISQSVEATKMLFRKTGPKLRFGKSWISLEAAAGNELAQLLIASMSPRPTTGLIENLHQSGEKQASDHQTRIVSLRGSRQMREALQSSPSLLPELKPYVDYLTNPSEPRGDGLAALRHMAKDHADAISAHDDDALAIAGYLALGLGFGDSSSTNHWRPYVDNWLATNQAALPIRNLCARTCPAEAGQCHFAFLGMSGGYFEVIRYDSPLEKVIPQSEFLNSRRAELMMLRHAALVKTETNFGWLGDEPELAEISQCTAKIIQQQREEY